MLLISGQISRWRHGMERLSASLALWEEIPSVTCVFSCTGLIMHSFGVLFVISLKTCAQTAELLAIWDAHVTSLILNRSQQWWDLFWTMAIQRSSADDISDNCQVIVSFSMCHHHPEFLIKIPKAVLLFGLLHVSYLSSNDIITTPQAVNIPIPGMTVRLSEGLGQGLVLADIVVHVTNYSKYKFAWEKLQLQWTIDKLQYIVGSLSYPSGTNLSHRFHQGLRKSLI